MKSELHVAPIIDMSIAYCDVVIVGAGPAGLAAAASLKVCSIIFSYNPNFVS